MMGERSRYAFFGVAVALGAILANARSAQAENARGVRLDRFEPAAKGSDFFVLDSLDLRGSMRPALGLVLEDGYRPLTLVDGSGNVSHAVVNNQLYAHVGAGIVLWERLRLGASLPLSLLANGESGTAHGVTYPAPSRDLALGDLRLDADARLFGTYGTAFTTALGASVFLPTGDRDAYAGDGRVAFEPHALAAGALGSFVYAARLGLRVRGRGEVVATTPLSPEVTYGLSAGARLLEERLTVGPELYGGAVAAGGASTPAFGLEALLGAHLAVTPSVRVGLAGGMGLGEGFGAALARGIASVEWVSPFEKPKPPPPPPVTPKVVHHDKDGDGVDDLDDACPDVPGQPHPGDPLANGCPADRDKDFIPDAVDACPDVRGTRSKDPRKNGCPGDKDGDGIPDEEDACELEAGVHTEDPATNGCADNDKDKDGIPDAADACPKEAGPADPDPAKSGCPSVGIEGDWIRTRDPIAFGDNSPDLAPGAETTLAEVAKLLTAHTELRRVRVEAHTDNARSPATSKKLSEQRANTVVKWLTAHGVQAARLSSAGYGSERPLMPNTTEEGRKLNRRIEIHVEEVSK